MVGFGSSLRMARRPGWERAYLDYETLKLLLSQIEAVYEEEAHRRKGGEAVVALGSTSKHKRRKSHHPDYRDELFLEEDSDKAFLSSGDLRDDEEMGEGDIGTSTAEDEHDLSSTTKPFTLGYSHEVSSDEGEESPDVDASCGSSLTSFRGRWRRKAKAEVAERKATRANRMLPRKEEATEDDYFLSSASRVESQQQHAFLVEGQDGRAQETSSLLVSRTTVGKRKKGISHADSSQLPSTHFSSFGHSSHHHLEDNLTPPHEFYGATSGSTASNWSSVGTNVDLYQPSLGVTSQQPTTTLPPPASVADKKKLNKLEEERRRKRRQRRRRLARKRAEREKKVPRHLRIAHSKARAITERFLGLLRAEVEKVTLFAQSRLGELADVAGSLRFPSYYDDSEFGGSGSTVGKQRRGRAGSFEHPLSDGGMHPSASSSEDERDRTGTFPWSDSSDEEGSDSSNAGKRGSLSPGFLSPNMRKATSAGGISVATETFSNLTNKNRDIGTPCSKKGGGATSKKPDPVLLAAQRQITHFAQIRQNKPIFQRLDHIVGEDLLLLSAVDEADGYTAVGVELMHVLRYICVNVIAIRKICRKHDRLLMNRMLGGYYHRKRKQAAIEGSGPGVHGDSRNDKTQHTLGGLVSQSLGDKCVDNPAAVTESIPDKLEGVFDAKIQQLANSNTVQVISSCIALALSEYEVSQSRADALAKLNPSATQQTKTRARPGGFVKNEPQGTCSPGTAAAFGLSPSRWMSKKTDKAIDAVSTEASLSMDELDGGPPSTSSTLSLTRLRFTVVSIFALREVARMKQDSYQTFLSRSTLVFTGPNVVGEGLDGCSREVLDFFVAYNPDFALLLDSAALYRGIREGKWRESPIGSVMLSALAMAVASQGSPPYSGYHDASVVNAVSLKPCDDPSWTESGCCGDAAEKMLDPASLGLNRVSIFLYAMNYYIVHSTARYFCESTGAHSAHSAAIIGGASLGALIAAAFQCHALSKQHVNLAWSSLTLDFYRRSFLFSAFWPFVGNVLYALAVSCRSIPLAVFGRFWIGFGSAELLSKSILTHSLPPIKVVPESVLLVKAQLSGVIVGVLMGATFALFDVEVSLSPFGQYVTTITALHTGSVFMAVLWMIHWLRLYFSFQKSSDGSPLSAEPSGDFIEQEIEPRRAASFDESAEDASTGGGSASDEPGTPVSLLYRSNSDGEMNTTYADNLEAAFGPKKTTELPQLPFADDAADERKARGKRVSESPKETSNSSVRARPLHRQWKLLVRRIRKVFAYSVAIPLTVAIAVFVKVSHEILFTSCAIITNRYFSWNGSHAGLLLGILAILCFPINSVCGKISARFDERTVIKHSLLFVLLGLLAMVNWTSILSLASHIRSLFKETDSHMYHPYDWVFGVYQYVLGLTLAYTGLVALEGTSLSLLSKLAPTTRHHSIINCATIVTFLGLVGRVVGDIQILMVGLSHRLINTDVINSLVIPLLLGCVALAYLVRRHFFFLM